MATLQSRDIPRSGSTALAAGALVQAILGGEFVLAGLNKLADPQYVAHFRDFVSGSAALIGEPLASLVRLVVLPNVTLMAELARFTELGAGLVLVLAGLSLTIYLLQGGVLPRVSAGLAFGPPIAIELFNVPIALAVAWMELGRFMALRRAAIS